MKPKIDTCDATVESMAVPNHTHTCSGKHDDDGSHFCNVCMRWWWERNPVLKAHRR